MWPSPEESMRSHGALARVDLGQVVVVGPTRERDILHGVVTAAPERAPMVELEAFARGAASPLLVYVAASASVAFVEGPLDGGWNLARLWKSVAL